MTPPCSSSTSTPSTRHGGGGGKPNKLVTPKLEMGIGPDKFGFCYEKWSVYKRSAKLTEIGDIRDQLTSCCSDELYEDLFRSLASTLVPYSFIGGGIDQAHNLVLSLSDHKDYRLIISAHDFLSSS